MLSSHHSKHDEMTMSTNLELIEIRSACFSPLGVADDNGSGKNTQMVENLQVHEYAPAQVHNKGTYMSYSMWAIAHKNIENKNAFQSKGHCPLANRCLCT